MDKLFGRLKGVGAESTQHKGGTKMNGLADVIVGLWFLPVTLYILIPLTMLFGWLIGRLIMRLRLLLRVGGGQDVQEVSGKFLTKAGV